MTSEEIQKTIKYHTNRILKKEFDIQIYIYSYLNNDDLSSYSNTKDLLNENIKDKFIGSKIRKEFKKIMLKKENYYTKKILNYKNIQPFLLGNKVNYIENIIKDNLTNTDLYLNFIQNENVKKLKDYGQKTLEKNNSLKDYILICENEGNKIFIEKVINKIYSERINSSKAVIPYSNTINSLSKRIKILSSLKVTADEYNWFLSESKNIINKYIKIYPTAKEIIKEEIIKTIIGKIATVESNLYEDYVRDNKFEVPSLEKVFLYKECVNKIFKNNIISIIQNSYVKEKTKANIMNLLPKEPKDEYPEARKLKRKFLIHVGYTNTGKTYSSIQKLKTSEKGIYLSPLRLLALEIQEKLNKNNIPCSLMTGEEEDIIEGAKHISCTVEKLNLSEYYDVCVIDECQMLSDKQRGFAWTRAIMGVLSKEVHLCTAPEGLEILKKIITGCGDTYEIFNHTRNTELVFDDKGIKTIYNCQKGDALIIFSKKKALAVASSLSSKNINASIIYGSLPYATRKYQFERFLKGETDVIVSTDAIGMGLNLPIQRVVFLEIQKYDGEQMRELKISEVKQIAGRAGRKGMYEKGYVSSVLDKKEIKRKLQSEERPIQSAYLGFPEILLDIDENIEDIIKVWGKVQNSDMYKKTDMERTLELIYKIKAIGIEVSNRDILKLATVTFDEKREIVLNLWLEYCKRYLNGYKGIKRPAKPIIILESLEDYYKCLDLYYSFSKNFGYNINLGWLEKEKLKISEKINNILISEVSKYKKRCNKCGKILDWDYPYGLCEKCYTNSYYNN